MPFNSNTYRMNKYRRQAWDYLAQARELKGRIACSNAYDWEIPRVRYFVTLARSSMRLHLSCRTLRELDQ